MLTAFSDAVNACQSVLAAEARGRGVLNAEIAGIAGDHSRGDALRAMQHRRRRSHKRVTLSDDVCELCADGAVGRGTRPDTAWMAGASTRRISRGARATDLRSPRSRRWL